MKFLIRALLACVFAADPSVDAQSVPALINYQGRIQNSNGTVPPTADYELSFRIYDAAHGGTLIWGPQVFYGTSGPGKGPKIPMVQGYFNVMLGQVDTANRSIVSAFSNAARYLEFQVGTNNPIIPRQQLLSAPYALRAGGADLADNASKLAGYDWSDLLDSTNARLGKLSGSRITDGTVGGNQIASNTITMVQWAGRPVGTNVDIGGIALSPTSLRQIFYKSQGRVDITNLVVSIRTSGKPLMVSLVASPPDPGDVEGNASAWLDADGPNRAVVYWEIWDENNLALRFEQYIAASPIAPSTSRVRVSMEWAPSSVSGILFPPPGLHTYRLRAFIPNHPSDYDNGYIHGVRLMAYEL